MGNCPASACVDFAQGEEDRSLEVLNTKEKCDDNASTSNSSYATPPYSTCTRNGKLLTGDYGTSHAALLVQENGQNYSSTTGDDASNTIHKETLPSTSSTVSTSPTGHITPTDQQKTSLNSLPYNYPLGREASEGVLFPPSAATEANCAVVSAPYQASADSAQSYSSRKLHEDVEDSLEAEREERPIVALPKGATYRGQWVKDKMDGRGTLHRADGSYYEGQFKDDRAEGQGKFTHTSGDTYEGEWHNDEAHGFGVFTHADGSSYAGQWKADMQSGYGVEKWNDNSSFEGYYVSSKKKGYGKFRWAEGSTYEGQFENNVIHGEGTYLWFDGRKYSGQWIKNHMHGHGKMEWVDGRVYIGQYENDKKHGEGRFEWPDGRIYEGEWREGKQHGGGVFVNSKGISRQGKWQTGKRIRWIDEPTPSGGGDITSPGRQLMHEDGEEDEETRRAAIAMTTPAPSASFTPKSALVSRQQNFGKTDGKEIREVRIQGETTPIKRATATGEHRKSDEVNASPTLLTRHGQYQSQKAVRENCNDTSSLRWTNHPEEGKTASRDKGIGNSSDRCGEGQDSREQLIPLSSKTSHKSSGRKADASLTKSFTQRLFGKKTASKV